MLLHKAEREIMNLLNKHNLKQHGWVLNWTLDFPPLGETVVDGFYRSILLSIPYVELNNFSEVMETIKHEIAHAITYERFGLLNHGKEWRSICREIGCKPELTAEQGTYRIPKVGYGLVCSKCDYENWLIKGKPRKKHYCPDCKLELSLVWISSDYLVLNSN